MRLIAATILVPALSAAGDGFLETGVHIDGNGPFRFLVDTGAQSCSISPGVARRLNLRPLFGVELETIAGVTSAAVAIARVEVQGVELPEVEILIHAPPGIAGKKLDGVLGQSFLSKLDYRIDNRAGELLLHAPEPEGGIVLPMEDSDGRPSIAVAAPPGMRLVLDSGASNLILFAPPPRGAGTARLQTANGAKLASSGVTNLTLGTWTTQVLAAFAPGAGRAGHGLLPLSLFDRVWVSNAKRCVRLEPRVSEASPTVRARRRATRAQSID